MFAALGRVGARGAGRPAEPRAADVELRGLFSFSWLPALGRVGALQAGRPAEPRGAGFEFPVLLAALGRVGAGLGGIAEIGAEVEFQGLLAALGRYGAGAVGGRRAFTS